MTSSTSTPDDLADGWKHNQIIHINLDDLSDGWKHNHITHINLYDLADGWKHKDIIHINIDDIIHITSLMGGSTRTPSTSTSMTSLMGGNTINDIFHITLDELADKCAFVYELYSIFRDILASVCPCPQY
eukprot:2647184-Amphidinium_carterae.1